MFIYNNIFGFSLSIIILISCGFYFFFDLSVTVLGLAVIFLGIHFFVCLLDFIFFVFEPPGLTKKDIIKDTKNNVWVVKDTNFVVKDLCIIGKLSSTGETVSLNQEDKEQCDDEGWPFEDEPE